MLVAWDEAFAFFFAVFIDNEETFHPLRGTKRCSNSIIFLFQSSPSLFLDTPLGL
jgi:hypothetical protein